METTYCHSAFVYREVSDEYTHVVQLLGRMVRACIWILWQSHTAEEMKEDMKPIDECAIYLRIKNEATGESRRCMLYY